MIDIKIGDCREVLKGIPDKSVHCCVTSPPYYGLRLYCDQNSPESLYEIGKEQSPDEYINNLVETFIEVKRVLRNDGICWIVIGDSYATTPTGVKRNGTGFGSIFDGRDMSGVKESGKFNKLKASGLKQKDLIGIPFRLAFALQADGWWWRDTIIWSKGNPMPSSVTDRTTTSHEYILLFSKSKKYFFDNEAIKEPVAESTVGRGPVTFGGSKGRAYNPEKGDPNFRNGSEQWGRVFDYTDSCKNGRNKRSVWHVNTKPYKGAHFATFPLELIEPCILAGTSEYGVCSVCGSPYTRLTEKEDLSISGSGNFGANGSKWLEEDKNSSGHRIRKNTEALRALGRTHDNPFPKKYTVGWGPSCTCNAPLVPATILDPFGGSGTVGQWCQWNNRDCILIELNPDYKHLIEERINEPPKQKKSKKKVKPHEKFTLQQNLATYFSS
jgi:DNA modification methylase